MLGLVDVDRELAVVVAIGDRRGRRRDGARDIGFEQAQLAVRLGRGQLDEREGADEPAREGLPGDREVEHRPLGGRAVERVGRNRHLAHRVALDASAGRGLGHAPDCRSGSGLPGRT
jgi:hypothetical protein